LRNSIPDEDVSDVTLSLDASRLLYIAAVLLVSVGIGFGIGLSVAWVFWPVQYVNADPADLRQRYKDDYIRMIGAAYVNDGDIAKARQRLNRLSVNFSTKSFTDLFIREQKAGRDVQTLDALALLAQGLGLGTYSIPTPTATPIASNPSKPAPVATTAGFQVTERTKLTCGEEPNQANLQFFVRDNQGKDLPNIGIDIRWENGEDTVYTGLKPERGIGYADFEAAPGTFTVTIPNTDSDIAGDLQIGEPPANCKNDRGATPRGWKLVFQQK
jgi:hypothetical protein